ncbi:MAG: hypothetical protein WA628_14985 [Terriglobales bacterium]
MSGIYSTDLADRKLAANALVRGVPEDEDEEDEEEKKEDEEEDGEGDDEEGDGYSE